MTKVTQLASRGSGSSVTFLSALPHGCQVPGATLGRGRSPRSDRSAASREERPDRCVCCAAQPRRPASPGRAPPATLQAAGRHPVSARGPADACTVPLVSQGQSSGRAGTGLAQVPTELQSLCSQALALARRGVVCQGPVRSPRKGRSHGFRPSSAGRCHTITPRDSAAWRVTFEQRATSLWPPQPFYTTLHVAS